MTVKELIKILSQYPEEAEVMFEADAGLAPVNDVFIYPNSEWIVLSDYEGD